MNGFLFDHATTGVDPSGAVPDATATFDFGYNWNSGLGLPGAGQFDLFSVALHEITHAMGFLSLVGSSGLSGISGTDPGVFSVYDSFLERGDGTALFGAGGTYLGTAADLISGDVFFDGVNARAGNGGAPVKLFAPGAFQSGSSISHIDPSVVAIMNPSISPALVKRIWFTQDIGILADIGWSLEATAAVPEPATLALMGLGLVGLAFGVRRRRLVRA